MDKLNGITIERAIRTNSDKQNNFIEKFTQAVKNLHRTHVQNEKIPDIKQVSISYAKQLNSSFCSNEDKIKIIKIFENIPDTQNFIHGNCHTGNAIISGDKIQFIDLMFCAKGHPVFDILCMYSHYVFLPSFNSDEAYILHLGLDKTGAENLYNFFIRTYYNEKTDDEIENIKEYFKLYKDIVKNPNNIKVVSDITFLTGLNPKIKQITVAEFMEYINKYGL